MDTVKPAVALIVAVVVFGLASSAQANTNANTLMEPYSTANRNPLVQLYGLPEAQSAGIQLAGDSVLALQLEAASHFTEHSRADEVVFIDGESYRATMQWRLGVSERFEVGVSLAYLSHQGGGMDGFIDDWHSFWGLPDGNRPLYARDQLQFVYQRGGEALVDLTRSAEGLADSQINFGWQLVDDPNRQWALRGALKFATGDEDQLLGSGTTDLSLGLAVSDQSLLASHQLSLHGSVGLLRMEGGGLLAEYRDDWVVYGSATMSWLATEAVSLKLQLDAHSAFYDSRLTELGSNSAQLIIGGAIRMSKDWVVDLAVSEDIAVDTAPDVVFHIGISAAL